MPFGNYDGSLQRRKQKQADAMQTPELSEVSMTQIGGQDPMGRIGMGNLLT